MLLFWVLFNLFVLMMLALDLGVFHRRSHSIKFKEALAWSAAWIVMALLFAAIVYEWRGPASALEFTTGYLIELSLSVDNLFVFLLVFAYFKVESRVQHKVLFWGIIGALVMRGVFIASGVALINRFHWVIYVFGAFLVFTGIKLAVQDEAHVEPSKNPILKLFKKVVPISHDYVEGKFFVRQNNRNYATPLFAVLIVVETTDVLFAVDSIPAILAITRDPFIVYTSNVFAILGLRSMYFALAGMMEVFHFLRFGLAAILVFIGAKMLLSNGGLTIWGFQLHYQIPIHIALAVVAAMLAVSILASLLIPQKDKKS